MRLDPDRVAFGAEYERFLQYNFHRPQEQEVLRDLLNAAPGAEARILLLRGEAGIGRRYLLESAVYQARSAGASIELVTLALEGFELDRPGNAFVEHLRHQVAKRDPEGRSSRLRKILEHATALFSTPSLPGMPAFSISLDVGMPLAELFRLFERSVIPGNAERERLEEELAWWIGTAETEALTAWLIDACPRDPRKDPRARASIRGDWSFSIGSWGEKINNENMALRSPPHPNPLPLAGARRLLRHPPRR